MSPSKLGVFANLALAATAVLLPPTITMDDLGDDKALEGLVIDPFARSVALECPGCAVATPGKKGLTWERNAGNAFQLDFDTGSLQDTLEVTGYRLFPPSTDDVIPFHVTQINPKVEEPLRLRVTGYELSFEGAETVSQDGMELLPINLHIASVEGIAVNPPVLTINVLKDASGRLMIASFDTTEITAVSAQDNCNEWPLLCKWKAIVAERIEQMKKMGKGKGCHKRPHGHHNPMEHEGIAGKPPHRFRPGRPHHRPHHGPHSIGQEHHYRMHRFASRALFTILIPIVIGVFAGTVTYLIGMVLGTIIAIVIARIRGQRYDRVALDEEEVVEEPEVQGEKADYAELPAYDAPPVYEDTPKKDVDESK